MIKTKDIQEAALLPYRIHIIHTQMAPFKRKTRSIRNKETRKQIHAMLPTQSKPLKQFNQSHILRR